MMITSGILLILAAVANAGQFTINDRIVNGQDASIADYPYQAAVFIHGKQWCGGSIIDTKYILTAAHCTFKRRANALFVRVGTSFPFTGGKTIQVRSIIQHEEFNITSFDNDVSILVLEEEIAFNEKAHAITLANVEPNEGWCVVSGWGHLIEGGTAAPILQAGMVPIIPRNVCSPMYVGGISEKMICAGFTDGLRDTCQGDSGGPLVSYGVQVGVVSWGDGCARPMKPSVYTNIAAVRPWIMKNSRY